MTEFEAVLFDLDSTITNTHHYPLEASVWFLSKAVDNPDAIGDKYVRELVRNYYRGINRIVDGAPYSSPYNLVRTAIGESVEALGLQIDGPLITEATDYFKKLHVERSTIIPGAPELLTLLQSNDMPLGVITNSFEGHLQAILRKLDISKFFRVLVDTSSAQAYKPMSEPFNYALMELGVKAEQSLYIGNEYRADIFGARSAGLNAIWINSRGDSLEEMLAKYGEETSPLIVIDSIAELTSFI
ncbi:MAG: HAD family hydrolase [Candidatus Thorarchaeota archaeon]